MKQSTQIIIVILIIIVLGIFWRISGAYMESRKQEKEQQQQASKQETTIAVPDTTTSIPKEKAVEYVAIEPIEKWPQIIIGKWEIKEQEYSENESWEVQSDAEFFKDKTFNLHTTIKYYDYANQERYGNSEYKLNISGGGALSGRWSIKSSGCLVLAQDTCDIKRKFLSQPSSYARNDYEDHEFRGCDFFQERSYGKTSTTEYQTEINIFNKDSIQISGKNYTTGSTVSYLLVKQ